MHRQPFRKLSENSGNKHLTTLWKVGARLSSKGNWVQFQTPHNQSA
jgi:hypothetical protein